MDSIARCFEHREISSVSLPVLQKDWICGRVLLSEIKDELWIDLFYAAQGYGRVVEREDCDTVFTFQISPKNWEHLIERADEKGIPFPESLAKQLRLI